jgi:hypothetical protein
MVEEAYTNIFLVMFTEILPNCDIIKIEYVV